MCSYREFGDSFSDPLERLNFKIFFIKANFPVSSSFYYNANIVRNEIIGNCNLFTPQATCKAILRKNKKNYNFNMYYTGYNINFVFIFLCIYK